MLIKIFDKYINSDFISHIERCSWYAVDDDKVECKLWMINGSPIQIKATEDMIMNEINNQTRVNKE